MTALERLTRRRRDKIELTVNLYRDQIDRLWDRARANSRPFAFELRDALDRGLGPDDPVADEGNR